MRTRLVFVVGLAASLPCLADAAPRRPGSASSRDHVVQGNPFQRTTLLHNIASGEEHLVVFDRAGGALQPSDPRSRYVVIRDTSDGKRHILGILTPHGDRQAESIFDAAALKAPEVGAVFRAVLDADRAATGRSVPGWRARVNLPDRISIDILHVHGDAGPMRNAPVAGKAIDKGDFTLHEGKTLAATASLPTAQLDAQHEELLGRMVLEVARAAKERGITDGSLEVSRSDAQLTVRVVTGGAFSWGSNE